MMPLPQALGDSSGTWESTIPEKKEKKSVSFQETITIVRFHDFGVNTWTNLEDRKRYILEARLETMAWVQKGCYGFLLRDTFNDPSDASAQEKMDAYAQLPGQDYCRGLERHVCREHGLKRDSFKKGAIRAIVNEGRKRQERGMPLEQSWMQLGLISRKLSYSATRFAHLVGLADERVVRFGEDASKVMMLHRQEMAHTVEKATPATPPCPVQEGEEKEATEMAAQPEKITIRGGHDQGEKHKQKVQRQDSPRSVTSVTSVNGWCHGPRESCLKVDVPTEVVNC